MKILIGLGVLVVLLVAAILSLPFLIDLNKYQDQYKPLIEEALNRKVAAPRYPPDDLAADRRPCGGFHGAG